MDKQTCFKCDKEKDKDQFPMLDGLEILSMICCECRANYNKVKGNANNNEES